MFKSVLFYIIVKDSFNYFQFDIFFPL